MSTAERPPGDVLRSSVILLVAAAFRLPFLWQFGIDDDEYYSLRNSEQLLQDPVPDAVAAWPVTFAVARLFTELFGLSPFSLRLFSVACGILAPWLLYRIGRRHVGADGAFLAALLTAVWPWHQYFSGLARYYSPLFLFALLLADRLHRALTRPRSADWALVVVLVLLSALTHTTGLLALGGGVAFALGRGLGALTRRGALLLLLGAAACGAAVLTVPPLADPVLRVISGRGGHGYDAAHFVMSLSFNLSPVLALLAALGAAALWRARRQGAWFLGLTAAAPIVVLCVLVLFGVGVQPRYAMAGMPALVLLAGAGAARLVAGLPRGLPRLAVVGAVLLPGLPGVASNLMDGNRHDVRGAAAWLERRLAPGDTLFAEGHSLLGYYLWGFERRLPPGLGEPPFPDAFVEFPPSTGQREVLELVRPRVRFVVQDNQFENPAVVDAGFRRWLRDHAVVEARFGSRRLDYHRNLLAIYGTPAEDPP